MSCLQVDGLLLVQTFIYFVIVAAGLATVISSSLARSDFGENCVLYGCMSLKNLTVIDNATTKEIEMIEITSSRPSICIFVTAVNLLICVFYALLNGCYHAYSVHRSKVLIRVAYKMWLKILLFGTVLSCILILVSACSLTVGLSIWCNSFTTQAGEEHCSSSQNEKNNWYIGDKPVTAGQYYNFYSVAETSCWVNVTFWLVQIAIYIHRLLKYRQMQHTHQDPFSADILDAFT